MDIRVCPNCTDELTQAYGGGQLHLYCQSCGYEAREPGEDPNRPEPDDRHKILDSKIVSIRSGKKSKDKKAKMMRDQPDRVPKRGTR